MEAVFGKDRAVPTFPRVRLRKHAARRVRPSKPSLVGPVLEAWIEVDPDGNGRDVVEPNRSHSDAGHNDSIKASRNE